MSGGHFDYKCHEIGNFAEQLGAAIRKQENPPKGGTKYDEDYYSYGFTKETLLTLKRYQAIIELAGNLAYECEWLFSGDTSDDSFKERSVKSINKFNKETSMSIIF